MVSFYVYDVSFLILFSAFVWWFLAHNKKAISREGIMFMYRTQFGVRAIEKVSKKFSKVLYSIRYFVIVIGLALMAGMLWMLGKTVGIYLFNPLVTEVIKAPPIAPLIPYFPELFGMTSYFPPFYFTYFILALAIVAIVHEFSHGIFMRLFKIKIKSTGLVFLGPILGAFVEEKKEEFMRKKKSEQMTVLAAGVFANLVTALVFYGLYVLFFFSSFTASGYAFNTYGFSYVPIANVTNVIEGENVTTVFAGQDKYYLSGELYGQDLSDYSSYILAYEDSPAYEAEMNGALVEADGVAIKNQDDLLEFLKDKNPGDEVSFKAYDGENFEEYNLTLGTNPSNESRGYVGIGYYGSEGNGVVGKLLKKFMAFKDDSTYYAPTWDGNFVYFVYYLLWWIMVINLLVALFNMLPLGMLDGGRLFYLGVLGISKSDKFAKWAYKVMGYAILFAFFLMMFFWFIRVI